MQRFIVLLLLFAIGCTSSEFVPNVELEARLAKIEDYRAIKRIVDDFSNLADTKDIDRQVLLFTEDAVVESFSNGERSSRLEGRQQIGEVFAGFLANFRTVYHQNGQQTIDLKGDTATAISYCTVLLIGEDSKTTLYAIYNDRFVKQNGQWLIQHRRTDFVHRDSVPLEG